MFEFILGCLLVIIGVVGYFVRKSLSEDFPAGVIWGFISGLVLLGLVLGIHSTTIYVKDNEGGLVIRKFGSDLTDGHIIAANNEKGPQAKILPPGWHFFYWPWIYDMENVPIKEIKQGQIGIVVAFDGEPLNKAGTKLSEQVIYAQEWDSPIEMLDGEKFLKGDAKGDKKGFRGPQLTVLTPGKYRFNPRLFSIEAKPYLRVVVGQVAVIKSNVGDVYAGDDIEEVNGTPIVPNGYRGIWNKALTPREYYMHPDAYEKVFVKTTNRVYSYTKSMDAGATNRDDSIGVRTKDTFEFPVDIRMNVKITALNAPYTVALLGDPDSDADKNGYDVLEERIILPTVRSIVRNSAESLGGLEYVNSRSKIEKSVSDDFKARLVPFRVETDGIFIARIGLSDTPEGKNLLQTQTDMEIAEREIKTWAKKTEAEAARQLQVAAAELADQQKLIVASKAKIDIEKNEAEALVEKAGGERDAYKARIEALETVENFVMYELAKEFMSVVGEIDLPDVLVVGGGGNAGQSGAFNALVADMLGKVAKAKATPVPKPAPKIFPKPAPKK